MGAETEGERMRMILYKAIDVWRRISEKELVRYRCFKDLATSQYSVQSADFYRLPLDLTQVTNLEKQCFELLAEQDPAERAGWFTTLEEAIAHHDREFRSC